MNSAQALILINQKPKSVPMSILDESWAQNIHHQTLSRLKERGGLSPHEIYWNINKLDSREWVSKEVVTDDICKAISGMVK